jgi:hypothetical protein
MPSGVFFDAFTRVFDWITASILFKFRIMESIPVRRMKALTLVGILTVMAPGVGFEPTRA